MCLVIVDLNVATRVLLAPADPEYSGVRKAFFGAARPHAVLVHGGRLTDEYRGNRALARALVELDRAARARVVPDGAVDAAAAEVAAIGLAGSNDHHILGLALVSGARVLCSEDRALRADFKDRRLIKNPRGKIYSKRGHRTILSHNC